MANWANGNDKGYLLKKSWWPIKYKLECFKLKGSELRKLILALLLLETRQKQSSINMKCAKGVECFLDETF